MRDAMQRNKFANWNMYMNSLLNSTNTSFSTFTPEYKHERERGDGLRVCERARFEYATHWNERMKQRATGEKNDEEINIKIKQPKRHEKKSEQLKFIIKRLLLLQSCVLFVSKSCALFALSLHVSNTPSKCAFRGIQHVHELLILPFHPVKWSAHTFPHSLARSLTHTSTLAHACQSWIYLYIVQVYRLKLFSWCCRAICHLTLLCS